MPLGRVVGVLGLLVVIGLAVIWTEARNLRLRQTISHLHHQRQQALERLARQRLAVSQWARPGQILQSVERWGLPLEAPKSPVRSDPRESVPLVLGGAAAEP